MKLTYNTDSRSPSNISLGDLVRTALRRPARVRSLMLIGMSAALLSTPPINAVELPQACVGAACGFKPGTTTPITWLTSGSAAASVSGNTMTINQSTESVTLNWASFNISADGKVIFSQPTTNSVALNRIFQESPSKILGSISTQLNSDATKAGGQVYLVNPNGFIFGSTGSVNASGILVSTLGISEDTFSKGLLTATDTSKPALGGSTASNNSFTQSSHLNVQDIDGNDLWFDASGNRVVKGTAGAINLPVQIVVRDGAELVTTSGGRLMLASQQINNYGTLSSPDGQIILAAGDRVYLTASTDPALRGLYVEVAVGGTAYNALTGNISANHGNVTLVGAAVNQDGRISASTTVSENGSVRLLARDSATAPTLQHDANNVPTQWQADRNGLVTLGANSVIDVSADTSDKETAVDDQLQLAPGVEVVGQQIVMKGGANITAHGGQLTMQASSRPTDLVTADPVAHIRIDTGAVIDLSGKDAVRSVADNIVAVELRGTELADSPDQRNGALRGATITVDARVGTPLANVTGAIANIQKTVAQRTSNGGTATFNSTGDVVMAPDAVINVSGGQTTFTGAIVNTSQLITADGKSVDIGSAKEDVTYVGVVNPTTTITHDRWGIIEKVTQQTGSHFEAGYVEGSKAGSVAISGSSLLLNGTLTGQAVNGAYQRDPNANNYATGGKLIIGTTAYGTNYVAPAVTLSLQSSNIVVADDTNLPGGLPLQLSTDYLTLGGFTHTEIYSNDTVTLAANTPLSLLAGSSFKIRASQININSNIFDPSGKLDFAAVQTALYQNGGGGISVADKVNFDVSGQWINDTEVDNKALPLTTLFQNAGSVSLTTTTLNSALDIGSDVTVIANGGAWLKSQGSILGGKGGGIALQSRGQNSAFDLGANFQAQAYGVNGVSGGAFTLAAGRVQVTASNNSALPQVYDPRSATSAEFFNVGTSVFTDHGFNSVNLIASGGTTTAQGAALQVLPGPDVNAIASTLQLSPNLSGRGSGGGVASFSTVMLLPDYLRTHPENISFSVTPYTGYDNSKNHVGSLTIKQGVTITGDPGTNINLSSINGSIDIQGSLKATAGNISAHISASPDSDSTPYDPALQITVGPQALLNASGGFVTTPNDVLLQRKLTDGGTIQLTADRGSILIEHGAKLDVSGASTEMDVATSQSGATYLRQHVASDAGAISVAAAESIGVYGELSSHAGVGDTGLATGGTLSISLTRNNALASGATANTFPIGDRIVELTNDATLPSATGNNVNGMASISTTQIKAAGVDDLHLFADQNVQLDAGVDLTLQRRLEIDSPVLTVVGAGAATVKAGDVVLGNSQPTAAPTATTGTSAGVLNVNAEFIDLLGSSTWQNIATANLVSGGDVRLRGTSSTGFVIAGNLNLAGDLNIKASRMYAATATHFSIAAAAHTVDIEQGATSPGVPLSAASSLTISAANIIQNGTLLAPFGTIDLNASNSLLLGANSYTSVSGDGALIPYGFTDSNGTNWFYNFAPVTTVPDRAIQLNGTSINIATGANVDLSGGGDLYGYEWIQGTGGNNDAFGFKLDTKGSLTATLTNPGLFAIIPSLGTQAAPFDTQEAAVYRTQGLQAGDSVYLSGGGTLAAGFYTLLPARYALLPGAYLVTTAVGFDNLQPGTQAALADGTPVVAGYRSFSNTGLGGTSFSGFAIYPGSWARELAEYKDSYASNYFVDAARRTVDAGQLSIITGNELFANGLVNSQAAKDGRAATIDVSANNLEIVGTVGTGANNVVQLDDDVLNNWKAGRLLLGGTHSADGSTITVAADNVTVAGDAHLIGDEVALVAHDQIAIKAGGSVKSNSANADKVTHPDNVTVTLAGIGSDQSAFVAVSDVDNFNLIRSAATVGGTPGVVNVASGATIATRGAISVAAPGGANLDGVLGGDGAQWLLSSGHIVFGDNNAAGQLTIQTSLLNSLQTASVVNLLSAGAIDFTHYASNLSNVVSIGNAAPLNALGLQASTINNMGGDTIGLHAHTINFTGLTDPAAMLLAYSGTGELTTDSQDINVVNNAMAINGFAQTNLNAMQLKFVNSGELAIGGNLNVGTGFITAGAAANGMLSATADVQLTTTDMATALPKLELGGALTIKATNIINNATIYASSGAVTLDANNSLTLGDGATIDVSGVPVYAAGVRTDSSGGVINLRADGNISSTSLSTLKLSGSANSNAGTLNIAAGGTVDSKAAVDARATGAGTGGAFNVSAWQINNFAALNDQLQTAGFTSQQSINVQQGNLTLTQNHQVTAHDVQWVTNSGVINVAGTISADSTADRSSIRLYGADGVTLTGQLHADGDVATGRGGAVEIGVSTDLARHAAARVDLQTNSVISAEGAERGRLVIRAPALNGNDVAIAPLNSDLSKLEQVTVEAVLPTFSSATFANAKSAATSYYNNASGNVELQARLQSSNNQNVLLSPGIDLISNGDLDVSALDLSSWHFKGNSVPVSLTIRASGSVNINGTVSDGFSTIGSGAKAYLQSSNALSATLRVVAGSNLSSADPLSINTRATADLVLADDAVVRTGTGNLSLAAARDVIFNSGSSVYTGGTNAMAQAVTLSSGASSSFLTGGGQLLINAGHDVLGYAVVNSVTEWQPRTGCVSACGNTTADQRLTSWGVDLRRFLWNAGTLGGGDLTVTAGNNITTLSAAVADSAKEFSNQTAMTYYRGGSLTFKSQNDIDSGMVYIGKNTGTIVAGGAVKQNPAWGEASGLFTDLGLLISMSDSQVNVGARNGIVLAGIVNPTMYSQPAVSGKQAYFYSYGADSSVAATSMSGDIKLLQGLLSYQPFFGEDTGVAGIAVSPASLSLQAFSGSVIGGSGDPGVMYPSSTGQLTLFAGTDIRNFQATMSDAQINNYSLLHPSFDGTLPGGSPGGIDTRLASGGRTRSAIHVGDLTPVSLVAGQDIIDSYFELAKSVHINAGRDIVDSPVVAQNVNAADVSNIVAGNDIRFTQQGGQIAIAGPGRVDIIAGRDVDLGISEGITTSGRLFDANLPDSMGADVTVTAGVGNAANWDLAAFIDKVVVKSESLSQQLIDYVQAATNTSKLTIAQAVTAFNALPTDLQRPYISKTFFDELIASGFEANNDSSKGYSRGYAAIDALLPGSRSENNPYHGDISMLYSRIYTLSGGDITLFAPGGELNVGVAAKPLSATILKEPGNLGLVAEGAGAIHIFAKNDVLVNSSRIFTLGGGDIAVWSTVGNIDAGKGAKTSLSIPPPSTTIDAQGNVTLNLSGAVAGSGIRTIQTDLTTKPGDVNLIAPAGYVNAGDAGIGSAGNINIAARKVIGAENINFGGNSTGVPAATNGLSVSLTGAINTGNPTDNAMNKSGVDSQDDPAKKPALGPTALSWLEVFVTGLGEENCKQDDVECLKRQK